MTNAKIVTELAAFDPTIYKKGDNEQPTKFIPGFKLAQLAILSDIITTMSLEGASKDEMADIVKYTYVLVDAEKCNLDYAKAYEDFKIDDLKKRYFKKENVDDKTEDRHE